MSTRHRRENAVASMNVSLTGVVAGDRECNVSIFHQATVGSASIPDSSRRRSLAVTMCRSCRCCRPHRNPSSAPPHGMTAAAPRPRPRLLLTAITKYSPRCGRPIENMPPCSVWRPMIEEELRRHRLTDQYSLHVEVHPQQLPTSSMPPGRHLLQFISKSRRSSCVVATHPPEFGTVFSGRHFQRTTCEKPSYSRCPGSPVGRHPPPIATAPTQWPAGVLFGVSTYECPPPGTAS